MTKELSEKLFIGLLTTDYDYISVRLLMRSALFPSAASLANIVLDRYIKMTFWCDDRNDLVTKIRRWGGDESHNALKMIELYNREYPDQLSLTEAEADILKNIHTLYCFRYSDTVIEKKKWRE